MRPETRSAGEAGFRPRTAGWGSAGEWRAAPAMGEVGVGLVDCHCHLSAPDFDRVSEG